LNLSDRYLELLVIEGQICIIGSEHIINVDTCLALSSGQNDVNLVNYFLRKGAKNINNAVIQAAKNGHLELLKYLVSLYQTNQTIPKKVLVEALKLATSNQHRQIIQYLVDVGKIFNQRNTKYVFPKLYILNNILIESIGTGNINLFDYIFSLGTNDLIEALLEASFEGSKKIIDHILYLDPSLLQSKDSLNGALYNAARGGHQKIINYLMSLGSDLLRKLMILITS